MKNSKELNEVQPRKRVPFFTHCLICSARIAAVVHGPNFNLDADGRPNWASQHRCPPTNPEKMEGYHAAESDAGGPTSQEVQQRLDEWLTAPTPEDE